MANRDQKPICPVGGDCDQQCPVVCQKAKGPRPIDLVFDGVKPALHFVGFRDLQRRVNAVRMFGLPDFDHYVWDQRAQREIVPNWDTVVFAKGSADDLPSPYNYDDSNQPDDPAFQDRLDR